MDGQIDSVEIPEMLTLYYSCMVVAGLLLFYQLTLKWYQDLGDCMKKIDKKITPPNPIVSAKGSIYYTIAWLFLFAQSQVIKMGVPLVLNLLLLFLNNSEIFTNGSLTLLRNSLIFITSNTLLISKSTVLFLTAVLYGRYCFDPYWIATNTDPDVRFNMIEYHWAYYAGFGSPYALILNSYSFFFGNFLFLSFYPLSIILGCISDHKTAYKNIGKPLPPIRMFTIAKKLTSMMLNVPVFKLIFRLSDKKGDNKAVKSTKIL